MYDPFKVYEIARSRLDGWLAPESVASIVRLATQQGGGDILEIGTYRGQSAAVLASLLRPNERLFISDLFESNHPGGDPANMTLHPSPEELLKRDVAEIAGIRIDQIITIKGPSQNLTLPGPFRIVHVDGSHYFADARSDILWALDRLTSDGFIAIDDFTNPMWPEVDQAVLAVLNERKDARVIWYDRGSIGKIYLRRANEK